MKKHALLISVAVVSSAVAACLCGASRHNADAAPSATVPTSASNGSQVVRGVGYIEPVSQVRRLIFRADGVIADCSMSVGQTVKQGETLMTLQNAQEQAAVDVAQQRLALATAQRSKLLSGAHEFEIASARHEVELARERARHARQVLARTEKLHETKAMTIADVEQAKTEVAQFDASQGKAEAELLRLQNLVRPEDQSVADSQVRLAEARLLAAQRRLQDTTLAAPCDGTVLEILKREGESARAVDNECVIVFADLSHVQVRAEIDEHYVHQLTAGQRAAVHGRGLGDARYSGQLVTVKRLMGKKTVFTHASDERKDIDVIQVLVDLPADFQAPVGLRVDIDIDVSSDRSTSAPAVAIAGAR